MKACTPAMSTAGRDTSYYDTALFLFICCLVALKIVQGKIKKHTLKAKHLPTATRFSVMYLATKITRPAKHICLKYDVNFLIL